MEQYATIKEIAERWNITTRRVQMLCQAGLLPGARKFGRDWAIPIDVARPDDHRTKEIRRALVG